jgi:hypothetical protein
MSLVDEKYYKSENVFDCKDLDFSKQQLDYLCECNDKHLGRHQLKIIKQDNQYINFFINKKDISYVYIRDDELFIHVKNKKILSYLTSMDLSYQSLIENKEYVPLVRKYGKRNDFYIKIKLLRDFPDKNITTRVRYDNLNYQVVTDIKDFHQLLKNNYEMVLMINKMYEMLDDHKSEKLKYGFTVRLKELKLY